MDPVLKAGETIEPIGGTPKQTHPGLQEGETLEPIQRTDSGGEEESNKDTGLYHGVVRGARNIIGFGKSAIQDLASDMPVAVGKPTGDRAGTSMTGKPIDIGNTADKLQGDTMLNKYVLAPAAHEKERAIEEAAAMHRTHGMESVGHGITSMLHTAGEFIPGVGPVAGSLLDRAREGDVSGAIGEGATYGIAPKLIKGAGGKVIDIARDVPGVRTLVPDSVESIGRNIGEGPVGRAAASIIPDQEEPVTPLKQAVPLGRIPTTGAAPAAETGEALGEKPIARDVVPQVSKKAGITGLRSVPPVAKPIPIEDAVAQARAINVQPTPAASAAESERAVASPMQESRPISAPSAEIQSAEEPFEQFTSGFAKDAVQPAVNLENRPARPQAIRVLPKEEPNMGEGPQQFSSGESALNHFGNILSKSDLVALATKRGIPAEEIERLLAEGKTVKGTEKGGHLAAVDIANNVKTEVPTTKLWNRISETYDPDELDQIADRANKLKPAMIPEGRTLGKGATAMQALVKRAFFPELGEQEGYGSANKVVTREAADAARASLQDKMFRSNAGLDPSMIQDAVKIGLYHLEAGARDFAAWSAKMVDELSDKVKPHLKEIWKQVNKPENLAKLKGSTARLASEPLPVGEKPTIADLGSAFAKFNKSEGLKPIDALKAPERAMERAVGIGEREMTHQLRQPESGKDWYGKDIGRYEKAVQNIHPELKDPAQIVLFKALNAGTSLGNKSAAALENAIEAYDQFKKTGKVPIVDGRSGKAFPNGQYNAYQNTFRTLQKVLDAKSPEDAATWLTTKHPISELREFNKNVAGKMADQEYGAVALGPKAGPFLLNMHGIVEKLTADVWFTRTWNRWLGTMVSDKGEAIEAPRNEGERNLMTTAVTHLAQRFGLPVRDVQAVLWNYEQRLYTKHGIPSEQPSYGTAAERVAEKRMGAGKR